MMYAISVWYPGTLKLSQIRVNVAVVGNVKGRRKNALSAGLALATIFWLWPAKSWLAYSNVCIAMRGG